MKERLNFRGERTEIIWGADGNAFPSQILLDSAPVLRPGTTWLSCRLSDGRRAVPYVSERTVVEPVRHPEPDAFDKVWLDGVAEQRLLREEPPAWKKVWMSVTVPNLSTPYEESLWWDLFAVHVALCEKGAQGGYREIGYGQQIREGVLDKFDLVLLPGGSGREQGKSMGPEGVAKLKEFVASGADAGSSRADGGDDPLCRPEVQRLLNRVQSNNHTTTPQVQTVIGWVLARARRRRGGALSAVGTNQSIGIPFGALEHSEYTYGMNEAKSGLPEM